MGGLAWLAVNRLRGGGRAEGRKQEVPPPPRYRLKPQERHTRGRDCVGGCGSRRKGEPRSLSICP